MSAREVTQAECYLFMRLAKFTYERRRLWTIWAAKAQPCPVCEAPPYKPCLNMSQLRRGIELPTRNPHAPRVDWDRFLSGLVQRGIAKRG